MFASPEARRQNQILRSIPSYIVAIFGIVICGVLAVSSLFSLAIMQLGPQKMSFLSSLSLPAAIPFM